MIADHDIEWLTEQDFWKNNLLAQIWAKWFRIRSNTSFFLLFSQVWMLSSQVKFSSFAIFSSLVFLKIAYKDTLQQFLTSSRGKIPEKIFEGTNLGQRGQNWSQNYNLGQNCWNKIENLFFSEKTPLPSWHYFILVYETTKWAIKSFIWVYTSPKGDSSSSFECVTISFAY